MKREIKKEISIGDLIKEHPETINVLVDHGMQCVGCHVAYWETLEEGAESHGINIDKLLKELNKHIRGEI